MLENIIAPEAGDKLKAEWAKSVSRVCNEVRSAGIPGMLARSGAGAFGNTPAPVNQRNRIGQGYIAPYSVKWVEKVSNDSDGGGWIIYLTDSSLVVSGAAIDLTTGMQSVAERFGAGWYLLPEVANESGRYILKVILAKQPDDDDTAEPESPTASIIAYDDSENAEDDRQKIVLAVADVSRETNKDDLTRRVTVIQHLVGTLALSNGGDGCKLNCELTLNGYPVAKICADANSIDITQKQLAAGPGIELSEANGVITISATAGGTGGPSGHTGTVVLGGPISYAFHQITQPIYTLTIVDGLIVDVVESSVTPIEAVEETV